MHLQGKPAVPRESLKSTDFIQRRTCARRLTLGREKELSKVKERGDKDVRMKPIVPAF